MDKVYQLIIPTWNAAIPKEWSLEIAIAGGEFESVGGRTIAIKAGSQLRGGPKELFDRMLEQQFIEEVSE